ncbi:hemoglobin subunit beta-like [Latimeria chalumnae]|nr:PREDICTED: hemoglobin subunit beta [Latimeria chalumnae]|eukprot:XP_006011109.1 PREDICTED: hemoglobin subunit beta [Latimeria chalumnae]
MVHWTETERATIETVYQKLHLDEVGREALTRLFIVYPWTTRYFKSFGDLSSSKAIASNPKVTEHGLKVMNKLTEAIHNLDHIKDLFHKLSEKHFHELHVDPQNFKLLSKCLIIVLATKLGKQLTPDVQATWEKLLSVVVAALSREYH